MVAVGGILAAAGLVATIVYFLQPWRSCPYEDTSAGCAMLPADATGMGLAICVAVIGAIVFAAGVISKKTIDPPTG
jgi:hypothetical protein